MPVAEEPFGRTLGRTMEMAALKSSLERARDGQGGMVLLSGHAGMGKTHLLRWLDREVRKEGLQSRWGFALEGVITPLFLWEQVFRAERSSAEEGVQARPPVSSVTSGESKGRTGEGHEFRYIDYLERLEEWTATGPSVVLLDDLQWSDPLSWSGLLFVGRNLRRLPVLMVGTCRDDEPLPNRLSGPSLAEVFDTLEREGALKRLQLRGLTRNESRRLVETSLGAKLTDTGSGWGEVLSRGEGNPYFLLEIVQYLQGQGLTARKGFRVSIPALPSDGLLPPSVRRLLTRRLDTLCAEEREILRVGSVIGIEFPASAVASAVERPKEKTLDVLRKISRQAVFLRKVPGDVERYAFTHALMREITLEDMPESTLRPVASRLAHWWSRTYPEDVDMVASLYHESDDRKDAWPWIHKAMFRAADSRAGELAERYAGWMRQMAKESGGEFPSTVTEEVELANTLFMRGEDEAGMRVLQNVLAAPLTRELRWKAELAQLRYLHNRDIQRVRQECVRLGEEFTLSPEPPPIRLRAELSLRNVMVQTALENYGEAQRILESNLRLIEEAQDPYLLSLFYIYQVICKARSGHFEEAEEIAGKVLDTAKGVDELDQVGMLLTLALAAEMKGSLTISIGLLRQAAEGARRYCSIRHLCGCLINLATILLKLGRVDEAQRVIDHLLYLSERATTNVPGVIRGMVCALRGELLALKGRWSEAEQQMGLALESWRAAGYTDTENGHEVIMERAQMLGELGRTREGFQELETLHRNSNDTHSKGALAARFHLVRGRLKDLSGDASGASEDYLAVVPARRGRGGKVVRPDFVLTALLGLESLEDRHGNARKAKRWREEADAFASTYEMRPPDHEAFPLFWQERSSDIPGSESKNKRTAKQGPMAGKEHPSLAEQILIHLARQPDMGPNQLGPRAATQEGIANHLGRPQNAFAKSLQRLIKNGLVVGESRNVEGSFRRRQVYSLTPLGYTMAQEIARRKQGSSSI